MTQIQALAQELPYAMGAPIKKLKKERKKRLVSRVFLRALVAISASSPNIHVGRGQAPISQSPLQVSIWGAARSQCLLHMLFHLGPVPFLLTPPDKSHLSFTANLKGHIFHEVYPDAPWGESALLPPSLFVIHLVWNLLEGKRVD